VFVHDSHQLFMKNLMFKRLLLMGLALMSFSCFAESTKDIATINKEVAAMARENNIESVKKYCIDYWTSDPNRRDILAKFSSVAETCSCIESEMKFTVSDDLAERLLRIQVSHQAGTPNKYASEEENSKTLKEWFDRYSAASSSCGQRFMRRRYP
jgi:hypothetical protein